MTCFCPLNLNPGCSKHLFEFRKSVCRPEKAKPEMVHTGWPLGLGFLPFEAREMRKTRPLFTPEAHKER